MAIGVPASTYCPRFTRRIPSSPAAARAPDARRARLLSAQQGHCSRHMQRHAAHIRRATSTGHSIFRAFEAELSELGCRPISLQLFDFRGIVDLEQRGASLDDFATFKMNPGHAPRSRMRQAPVDLRPPCRQHQWFVAMPWHLSGAPPQQPPRFPVFACAASMAARLRSVSNRNRPPTAVAIIVPINTSFAGTRRTGLMISPRGRYL